jgi:hypothetical protein
VSKNWWIDATHCFMYRHRPSVNYLIKDVITTYKEIMKHHPTIRPSNKAIHTHLFYIPNPNENMVMMFGSWQLQLVTTSYDNHGQADYQLPWVEGEDTFEQNWEKIRHHLNGKGSCFVGIWDGGYWPLGPNFIWQVSISSSFFTLLFGFEFCC